MSKLTTVFMMLICLWIGILIGYSAKTIAVLIEENKSSMAYDQEPRRTIMIEITVDQQEILFDKMQTFAEEQGFAIRIAPTSPNGNDYIVEMWREDTKIIALNSFDPGIFRVGFFDTDSAVSSPEWALNALVNEFRNAMSGTPGLQITEE